MVRKLNCTVQSSLKYNPLFSFYYLKILILTFYALKNADKTRQDNCSSVEYPEVFWKY